MDSLERRQPQWIPYSNFPPAATAPRHEGTGAHAPGDHGEQDQGRAGRHGLRGRGQRAQQLLRAGPATPVGDIVLRIPKLRAGAHFPEGIIERYSHADQAVAAAVAESWTNGVSTRKMERIARKMGIGRLSKYQVIAMCRSFDAEVGELASRDLGEIEGPYLLLDATHVKCRRDGRVQSTAVVTAIDVGSTGVRRAGRGLVEQALHLSRFHAELSEPAAPDPTRSEASRWRASLSSRPRWSSPTAKGSRAML